MRWGINEEQLNTLMEWVEAKIESTVGTDFRKTFNGKLRELSLQEDLKNIMLGGVTLMTRQEEFEEELKALLRKYQVEISIESSSKGNWYPDYKIQFFSYPIYKNGDCIAGGIDIEASYFSGK